MKIIIVGAGEVGFQIAEKLSGEKNKEVVLIDRNAERLRQIEEHIDGQFIMGSGSSPDILIQAGIRDAEMVIAVSDQDEVNLATCLVASHYSPGSIKIARLRNPAFLRSPEVFDTLNFNLFINPEYEAAHKIARLIEVPQALDLVEFADGRVLVAGFRIGSDSKLINRKMLDLGDIALGYTPLAAAIYRGREAIIPRGADTLQLDDIVYFSLTPDTLPKLLKLIGKKSQPIERVMIYGGSNTGLYLSEKLEEKGIDVKIIEPDEERCGILADQLSRATVLCGEGVDGELLEQENVSKMDVFVSVSKDDESNIFACLLAKSMGARYTMTLSNRGGYASLIANLGIDAAISPQLAAVSRIMRFLREGKVEAVEAIRQENVEGIEFIALETSDAVGRPLKDIKFPKGALVIAVVHDGQVIIPSGNTVIFPEDRVIIFAERSAIAKAEKLFSVKLEYF